MSWQERDYAREPARGGHRPGGLGSWLGGMPSAPKAVKGIIVANVVLFVLCLLTGGRNSWIYEWMWMRTDDVLHGHVWRLVTCTYMHAPGSVWHILFNMLGLYLLGPHLERHWGARRFFIFYSVAGLAAVLLYFLLSVLGWFDPIGILIGASGGVLAVVGACAVLFPRIQLIVLFFPMPIRTFVMLFGVIYLVNVMSRGSNAGGDACHLAGLAFGIAWGYRGDQWMRMLNRGRSGPGSGSRYGR